MHQTLMYKIIGGDQKVYGPVTGDELRRWIAESRLNGQSLIQAEGAREWQPLSAFPEFGEALGAQTVQPPLAGAAPPSVSAEVWTAQVLARQPQVQIGRCLSLSWQLVMSNFGLFFGATFLAWLIGSANLLGLIMIPLVGVIPGVILGTVAGVICWLIHGVIYGGLYLVFLKRIRGQPASVGDTFAGFGLAFAQLMLAGVVSSLLSWIGFCCCILPTLYLMVAWVFSVPLVADKRLEFWSAMELSRKVVTRVWFEMFGLMLLIFLPVILASIFAQIKMPAAPSSIWDLISSGTPDLGRLLQVLEQIIRDALPFRLLTRFVLLLTLPFALGALMYAYEDLFGARTTPTA
jgi:hypothetical protein